MASLALQLRAHHLKPHPSFSSFSHFLSTSSSDNNNNDENTPPTPTPTPTPKPSPNYSSYFGDIKSRLSQHSPNPNPSLSPKLASFSEIQKNLSEFRRRSTPPPTSGSPTSLQDLYNRNVNVNANAAPPFNPIKKVGGSSSKLSFDEIRNSLRQLRNQGGNADNNINNNNNNNVRDSFASRSNININLNNRNMNRSNERSGVGSVMSKVIGGTEERLLPGTVFGKEMKEGGEAAEEDKYGLIRMYTHVELGERLRELRPTAKERKEKGEEKEWFSLGELQERLRKLREIEEKESRLRIGGGMFSELRKGIRGIKQAKEEKNKRNSLQGFDILGTSIELAPPKEQLIEKYFHPDNMSAAEKLKLELKKVRDEFKMSESDCGSTRVQIAQLTTEILHLSSVLHKKDKHSRRGLQAKVQQRKKLLKYLRRTDWDSYCFVLSKLGLRDNPDYKN